MLPSSPSSRAPVGRIRDNGPLDDQLFRALPTPTRCNRNFHASSSSRLSFSLTNPGGRRHPAWVERQMLALADDSKGVTSVGLPESRGTHLDLPDATILLVRGVPQDEGLFDYDAAFEDTRLPADLLWGPGNYRDAIL